jgi:hypothetical protein
MSQLLIRQAFEQRLAALSPNISTAYENAAFTPDNGTAYQQLNLLPGQPDNSTLGSGHYIEVGLFQITLCYPNNSGPKDAYTQAELIKAWFKRGTSMVDGGVTVNVIRTPAIAPPMQDTDRYKLPISIYYQADIYS